MKEMKKQYPLNAAQVSLVLGISEFTVKAMAKDGDLPCVFIKRSPKFNFEKLLEHFESLERSTA